jgi:hypothetical protein
MVDLTTGQVAAIIAFGIVVGKSTSSSFSWHWANKASKLAFGVPQLEHLFSLECFKIARRQLHGK